MIQGGLNPAPQTQPGMLTGDDMSSVPLVQLNQLVQQGNPGVKAAAILELAKRSSGGGGRPVGMGGSGSPGLAPVVAAGADAMPGMQPVQSGITASSENPPAAQSTPPAPVQPARNPMAPSPPSNPALDAISTGAGAAADVTNATPSATDSGQAFPLTTPGQNPGLSVLGGQATDDAANPGIASIGGMAPTAAGKPLDIHPDVTTSDKLRALSKGFFTLASSKQPGFLGAVGEGGNAAADALQAAQDRAQQGAEFGVSADQNAQQLADRRADQVQKNAIYIQQRQAINDYAKTLPATERPKFLADPTTYLANANKGPKAPNIQTFRQGDKEVSGYFDDQGKFVSMGAGDAFAPQHDSANYGQQPIFVKDAKGNVHVMQFKPGGGLQEATLPPDMTVAPQLTPVDTGTGTNMVDRRGSGTAQVIPKDVQGESNQKAQGEATGKAEGTAQANLPAVVDNANNALAQVDKVMNDPALGNVTGWTGLLLKNIPGTAARGLYQRIEQLRNGAFLQAYTTLRGAGAITDIEGQKATSALARLDTAQNIGDFQQALRDYSDVIRQGVARMQNVSQGNFNGQSGSQPAAQPQPSGGAGKVLNYDSQGNLIP